MTHDVIAMIEESQEETAPSQEGADDIGSEQEM